MGKIANILKGKGYPIDKAKEARDVLVAGKEKLDVDDLEASVDFANLDIIKGVVRGLKAQAPKVEIAEKIISQAIGKFDIHIQYELLAMQELISAVIDSGAKVTHKILQEILNSTTLFKSQMFVEIFEAMRQGKTFTHEAVEFIFKHLNTHHVKNIAEKKGKVIDAYLESGGKVDEKMKDLASKNGINLEARAKANADTAEFVKRKEAEKLAKPKPAAAGKQKPTEKAERKEEPRPSSPGLRTW